MMGDYHVPVMLDLSVDALQVKKDKLYFDGTLGGGGHSGEILKRGGRLIATDLDAEALAHCQKKFAEIDEYSGKFRLVHGNFKNFKEIMRESGIEEISGAVLDLGISSHQIDSDKRGFAYMIDQVLDMRMDQSQGISAFDVVNEYSEEELSRIIFVYGEDRFAKRIAKNIVISRKIQKIETTGQLAEIVKKSVPKSFDGGHPAKKTFQAIRIEVNGELAELDMALKDIFSMISTGGRLSVISFHSLEDRIVKKVMNELSAGCICDKSIPICICGHKAEGKIIGKKIRANDEEQKSNTRSKSATLRILEKL